MCKKRIEYNRYKRYRDKILCLECYATRLERKKAKKEKAEKKVAKDTLKNEKTGDNMPVDEEKAEGQKDAPATEDTVPYGYNYDGIPEEENKPLNEEKPE